MRRIISFFRKIISTLSSWRDNAIEWLVKTSFPNFSYKEAKRKIDSLENLKVLDNWEDIQLREKADFVKSLFWTIIFTIILFASFSKLSEEITKEIIKGETVGATIYLVIFFTLVYIAYYWMCRLILSGLPLLVNCFFSSNFYKQIINQPMNSVFSFLVKRKNSKQSINFVRKFSFLIFVSIMLFLGSGIINYAFRKAEFKSSSEKYILIFSLIVIMIFIIPVFRSIIKSQPNFQIGVVSGTPDYLLLLIPIIKIINESWSLGTVVLTFSATITKLIIDSELKKRYADAQKIFEVQLLSNNPDYEELKKCYYHGGEKYKEKLLSTEKFLRLIKQKEVYQINYKRQRRWRRILNRR